MTGVNRQQPFLFAHPEAGELVNGTTSKPETKATPPLGRFLRNHKLLERLAVTEREMCTLEQLRLLGKVTSTKSFVAILTLIRDDPAGL